MTYHFLFLVSGSIFNLFMESRYGNSFDFSLLLWPNVQWSRHSAKLRDSECTSNLSKLACVQWAVKWGHQIHSWWVPLDGEFRSPRPTEPVVFVLLSNDVAVMLWHVLVAMSACTMPWLDDKNWKLYECFDKDFPIMTLLSPDCVVDNLRCSC